MKSTEILSQDNWHSCRHSKRTLPKTRQESYGHVSMFGHNDIKFIIAVHHGLKLMVIYKQSDVN